MKNKAKRIVSAVCALAMCAAMLPAAAMAADGETDSAASNAADTATVDETASDGTTDGTEPGADSQPAPAENSGIATLSDPVEDLTGDDLGNVLYVNANYTGGGSTGAEDAPFTTIQEAIDAVEEAQQAAIANGTTTVNDWDTYESYTITVLAGEYDRFLVPHGVANLTIQGRGDTTIVKTLSGESVLNVEESEKHASDNYGIIVWGANITLANMKILSGTYTKDVWYAAAVGTYDGMWGSSNEESTQVVLDNCTFEGSNVGYAFMPERSRFTVQDCSIRNYEQAIYFACDNYVTEDCKVIGNTISGCTYAIHGYFGGAGVEATAPMVIQNNTISGVKDRFTVIAILDQSNLGSAKVDISGNTFSYAIVGCINMREDGAVVQGSMEAVQAANTLNDYSFIVDAYWYSATDYGTTFYAPKYDGKIATWYSDPTQVGATDQETAQKIAEALNEYGTAGQVIEINAPMQEAFTLVKNALVIQDYVDAGDLKITKQVTNHVEDDTTFDFTIHFDRADGNGVLNGRYEYSIDGGELQTATLVDGNMTVSLKAGQSVTIQDMLPGTKYTVTEVSSPLYIASGNGATGTIVANQTQEVTVTNEFLTDASHGDDSVAIDKNATDLVNDQTNVTLSVGGTEDELSAYVLFVLDKSTSNDVRAEAAAMLEELMGQVRAGYKVNVAIMSFERAVDEVQDWMVLDESTYETIKTNLTIKRDESGTNIYLGLREAKEKLDALTDVDPAYKQLVLVTDGITYLWSNSEDENDTNLYSIYSESISNGEESINAGNDMMASHHADYDAFVAEFADMAKWMSDHGSDIAADIAKYQHVYAAGQYRADQKGLMANSTYKNAGFAEGDYIPGESLTEHYSANEAAIYMAATVWQEIVDAGYHAYAFADVTDGGNDTNARTYPWASRFIYGLHTIGGNTGVIGSGNVDGMFDDVKSSVVYAIESGTVTDVIGNDFDLTDVSSFELTVGGQAAAKEVSGNTVTFNGGDYVVTYHPATADQDEYFTWDINTRVENGSGLQLTYTLKLVNKASEAGDYTVPTNEIAYLEYTSTTGGQGSQEFPVPTVDYNIPPETVTVPSTPTPDEHPDIAEGIANGTWGGTPTPTPTAQTTAIPQTSDDLPLGLLIVVAIAAAGAVCGLVVLRKRSKQ